MTSAASSSGRRRDPEVFAFVNDRERPIGTYLYGRRMYETMAVWQTLPLDGQPPEMRDFAAIWRAAAKVVYSSTLTNVATPKDDFGANVPP